MNYPRVLMVHISCLNMTDQHGLSLRSWFADWPKELLAQIYSGAENDGEKFCGRNYNLGPAERYWGSLFFNIKNSALGRSSQLFNVEDKKLKTIDKKILTLSKIGRIMLDSGLWEFIFPPKLSRDLGKWIVDFRPQIIYCQGYDLSFCWLPLMISKKFQIPIVFQTTDDWPNYLYWNNPFIHPIVIRTARKLIKKASIRLAICDRMAVDYQKQFTVPFETVMICDNVERFTSVVPRRIVDKDVISVIYSGGLGFERWKSLLDLCAAAEGLEKEGLRITITAFTTSLPFEATNILLDKKNLQILPPLSHEQLPSYLRGADILFLPETFNLKMAKKIRYSISQKSHLYMMSEQPILAYGSPLAGVVDYAKREGWAYVLDEQRAELLVNALRLLSGDHNLRTRLIQKACQVALKNHNEIEVRLKFLKAIQSITGEEQING